MSARLTGQTWLTAEATRAVMDALEAEGGPDCARFVGGCVRNALIGAPVDDIDIATTLTPERTERAIRAGGLKAVPTGIAHGTVTAVAEHRPFEITSLRRDVSTDGRKATVVFTDDWAEDAGRRDFRLNALYADGKGVLFDPTGHGVADAEAGRIVFVGDPDTRIREDFLRILRFFRFFAWYGRGAPDEAALAACRALAPAIDRLSAERVSKELIKLMSAPDPVAAVLAMNGAGVLAAVLPEARLTPAFVAAVKISEDPVVRLSALLPVDATLARQAASRLRFPNRWRDRLTAAAETAPAVRLDMSPAEARAVLYRHGRQACEDAVRRVWSAAEGRSAEAESLLRLAADWTAPRLPVGGREVARLGLEPGPETGRVLKAFEDGWIADDFPTEGHQARLESLINGLRG
ncbi:MAG TPA: CCA tRNA nucleotidyltransferase [Brevundimonas sp.]|nr:CCA tRNA nucleotidyltransferase [Brevundimonas sp.]